MKMAIQAELTFTITVKADLKPSFGDAVDDKTWIKDEQIAAFTLPVASGGDGTLSYALSPGLPDGVTKDANHRVSGTPSATMSATAYTWTATDEDGDTAELTFMITVKADLKPSFGDAVDDKTWIKDEQIAAFTLPAASGGDGTLSYALSPGLPDV